MQIPKFIGDLPVVILRGPARGCWWTLYPWTSYWRLGGHEARVDAALNVVGSLDGKVAWDCGAHFGIYAIRFSRQVGPMGQVAAFEPDPVSFGKMQRHMRLNRTANVVLVNAAASDTDGEATIVFDRGRGGTTSHLPYPGEVLTEDSYTETIKSVRADDLVAAGTIRLPHLIKVDVEGHGGEALAGARDSLREAKPIVIIAMHSPQEIEAVRKVADSLNYELWDFRGEQQRKIGWGDCALGGPYLLEQK